MRQVVAAAEAGPMRQAVPGQAAEHPMRQVVAAAEAGPMRQVVAAAEAARLVHCCLDLLSPCLVHPSCERDCGKGIMLRQGQPRQLPGQQRLICMDLQVKLQKL